MAMRTGRITRRTTETDIAVEIGLDGSGKVDVDTTIPFLDHMLHLFAHHGLFDLSVKGRGDTAVDDHHLVEDLGICLGQAVKQALGKKEGINRYGSVLLPMDESLCSVAMDLSGRPYLVYHVDFGESRIGLFDPSLLREFFKSFSDHSGITLHINLIYGKNSHHIAEAVFKASARALRKASSRHERISGIMSTKGTL
jgi:imidazoleglycerol-phosphate dehydratase